MAPLSILLVLSEFAPLAVKSSGVNQSPRVITAQVGQTVILKCFCGEDSVTFFSWYQQKLGGKPVIISSRMRHDTEASISPSFKGRFQVDSRERINHLTISDLLPSDSAVYYCGILEFNLLQFGEGTFLHVRMPLSNIQVIVYQPGVSPVGPGDSVELGCEVRGKKCEGEQSFYFFRQTTDHPVTIHPMEGNCVNEARSRKCTLTYSIQSVNSSDEGVYYCALASCGQIMLGNGAQVQLRGKAQPVLVYGFSAALAVSILLLFALAFTVWTLKKQICSVCKGTVAHQSGSAAYNPTSQNADELHYAVVGLKRSSGHDSDEEEYQREESVCLYSKIMTNK